AAEGVGATAARTDRGDVVLPSRRLQHRAVAEDDAQADQRLRHDAIVIVALRLIGDGPGRAEADAGERGGLERDRAREPPLADAAERDGRVGDPEDLRRE